MIFRDFPADKWPKDIWAELFQFGIKKYIKSIRDVIRYTNVFLLKYDLLKDETDPVDLLALTCLQVFEPFIYSNLPGFKEFLCGDDMSNRIEKFVETDSFTHLTEDEKLNTILFLKTAKQQNKEDSSFGGVPEDALADWLEQTKH